MLKPLISGFSISPPPPNRQSSDSAFSNHTDSSNITKPSSSFEEKISTATRTRKRSVESDGNVSMGGQSSDFRPTSLKRIEELRNSQKKRPRLQSENTSQPDSDYEDNSGSYLPETDSDEPLIKNTFKCKFCPKQFTTFRSLANHSRIHTKSHNSKTNDVDTVVNEPKKSIEDAADVEDKLSCDKCGKTFKLKIMLKRHSDVCLKTPVKSPQKELLISLAPIDAKPIAPQSIVTMIPCEYCVATFRTQENLAKHMKMVHAAVLKREAEANRKVPVPCLYCDLMFNDYHQHNAHFVECPKLDESKPYVCPVCDKWTSRRTSYYQHLRNMHFEPRVSYVEPEIEMHEYHECRMCSKKLVSKEQLIKHLSAHVSNIQDDGTLDNDR